MNIRLKEMSLKKKATYGFITVFAIMFVSAMIGLLGLLSNSAKFESFKMLTEEGQLANAIDSYLYAERLAFKKYETSSDESFVNQYKELDAAMRSTVDRYLQISKSEERRDYVKDILAKSTDYRNYFEKYEVANSDLEKHYEDGAEAGTAITNAMTAIMKTAKANNDSHTYILVADAYGDFLNARLKATKYFDFHDEENYKSYEGHFQSFETKAQLLKGLEGNIAYKTEYFAIVNNIPLYKGVLTEIQKNIQDIEQIMAKLDIIGPEISVLTAKIKTGVSQEEVAFNKALKQSNQMSSLMVGLVFLAAIILGSIVIIRILKLVLGPINFLKETFESIAQSDANTDFRLPEVSNDEIGQMGKAFNIFMVKLKTMIDDVNYKNLLKTSESDISEMVRIEDDMNRISSQMIQYLCQHFDMLMGAVYIANSEGIFDLHASYAYTNRKHSSTQIKEGHGVLGQVLREKKMFVIHDLPEDYALVQSGLGDSKPKSVIVLPCMNEGEIVGIIEMASFNALSPIHVSMLEVLSDVIGRILATVKVKHQMKELFEKTLAQSEELQVQQEELRQSNEELEEQARALKESEGKLQLQQEELRVTNEELEVHSKQLEEQKRVLNERNEALELTQVEMTQKAQALEKANKYKSEFLANMSHELRTPLNSILVLSQLLATRENGEPLSAKEMEFASTIHSSGKDLLTLINGVLDLSKVEAGKLQAHNEKIALETLLIENKNMFEPMAELKQLKFEAAIEPGLPAFINSDSLRLNQIIKNLISNAIKFTHTGQISLDFRQLSKMEQQKIGSNAQNYIAIEVSDTGIGIPKDKLEEVFEAFKQSDGTTSRQYGGTGLGLTISLELAKLLGGDILLESEVNQGSSFVLILPQNPLEEAKEINLLNAIQVMANYDKEIEEDTRNDVEASLGSDLADHNGVLIIEDDPTFAQILSDLAEEKGYQVTVAYTGKEGIACAKTKLPKGIILDIGLPDMDGMILAKMLSEDPATKHIPIHIISGSEGLDEGIREAGTPESIIGFLKKPVDIKSIYKTLAKIENVDAKGSKRILVVGTCGNEDFKKFTQLGQVHVQKVLSAKEAFSELEQQIYSCIILDVKLPDINGVDFMRKLRQEMGNETPIIIYTEEEIQTDEIDNINKYAETIILKSSKSKERLVDEASLFLHGVERSVTKTQPKGQMAAEEKSALSGVKVLLADDDSRNVFALMHLLEKNGMSVVIAKDGHEATSKFEEQEIDLILMDIMMPGMDGYDAIRKIRSTHKGKQTPIIALTAKAMSDDREKCIAAGANDYLTKPVEISKLLSMMKVWLS